MKITLKLFATLSDKLPANSVANTVEVDVPDGATAMQVIDQFQVPEDMVHLVLVNGVYLTPEARGKQALKPRDALAIWPPVAGG
ncbi:MAG: MoaD/ThiS family protein [Arenicellales bacterium]